MITYHTKETHKSISWNSKSSLHMTRLILKKYFFKKVQGCYTN